VIKILVLSLLVLGLTFPCPSDARDTDVADSWWTVARGVGGVFTDTQGAWREYAMTDTDVNGRNYIDLWLVPNSVVTFKALFLQLGDTKFEPDFATATGRRTFTIPTVNTTVDMNWADTPDAPTGLTAYSDTGQVTLTWSAGSSDRNHDVRYGGGYWIYYDTGPAFDTWLLFRKDTIAVTTTTCTNLTNDSVYFFHVRAVDAYFDTGPLLSPLPGPSGESVTVRPGVRTNVQFRVFLGRPNDSVVYVGFDTGGGWSERQLYRENADSHWWSDTIALNRGFDLAFKFVVVDTAANKTFEFPVSGGRKHLFLFPSRAGVTAVKAKGSWDWGAPATMKQNPDSYWRADVNIANAGVYEYGFEVNGGTWETDVYNPYMKGANSVIGIDATPNASTMRRLVVPETTVTAVVSANWEDTPYAPTDFLAMPNTNSTVLITWSKVSQVEDIDSYRIEYSENPGDTNSWITLVTVHSDSSTYIHQNIIVGDTYYYRIYSIDLSQKSSDWKNFASTTVTNAKEAMFLIRKQEQEPSGRQRQTEMARKGEKRKQKARP